MSVFAFIPGFPCGDGHPGKELLQGRAEYALQTRLDRKNELGKWSLSFNKILNVATENF